MFSSTWNETFRIKLRSASDCSGITGRNLSLRRSLIVFIDDREDRRRVRAVGEAALCRIGYCSRLARVHPADRATPPLEASTTMIAGPVAPLALHESYMRRRGQGSLRAADPPRNIRHPQMPRPMTLWSLRPSNARSTR
jgi:hypothetical protein